MSVVFLLYSSTLHTSLVHVQSFSLMVTTHNSTPLKTNGMTADILFLVLLGKKFLYPAIRHIIMILSIFLGDIADTLLQITRVAFSMFSLRNLQPEHRWPCILPSSTNLDLIPSNMGLFHLLQMLLRRSSLSTHISLFHHCEQPFSPSI